MLLSEIVRRFFVLPFGQSEIACFDPEDHPELGGIIVLTWNDSYTDLVYRLEFADQAVREDAVRGLFTATTIDGDLVAFIALDGVDLTSAES